MALKTVFGKVKQSMKQREISVAEAKVMAMLAVVRSDQKSDDTREMGMMNAICSFDKRLENCNFSQIQDQFEAFQGNLESLFETLANHIHDRANRLDLFASAWLLAAVDGHVTDQESQVLDNLSKALRMQLEEIDMVKERTAFIIDTMKELRILT